jgi:hypothetical protein
MRRCTKRILLAGVRLDELPRPVTTSFHVDRRRAPPQLRPARQGRWKPTRTQMVYSSATGPATTSGLESLLLFSGMGSVS